MWKTELTASTDHLTCPFCGLACDDLQLEHQDPNGPIDIQNGCETARNAFTQLIAAETRPPMIAGRPVALEEALERCVSRLREARAPLFGGLATDVNGMRAALSLADQCGALLDHVNSDALFRNQLVQQDSGWMTTTLTEARNRADLVVLIGSQWHERFPRLIERVLSPPEALFTETSERRFVLIGPYESQAVPAELRGCIQNVIQIENRQIGALAGLLRGLVAGRPVRADAIPDVNAETLLTLAEQLKSARYALFIWSAAELDFPHAELTVQTLSELVRDLNQTTRAAALPLAGTLGDITVNQVCTWQSGYPLRTDFQQQGPRYDPMLNRHQDILARNECDLLLWIAAIPGGGDPPSADCPTLVLGHPGLLLERPPEVFIPVGVPGIDHPGHWYRSDAACPLPLGQIRDLGLPSVAQILTQLGQRLAQTAQEETPC